MKIIDHYILNLYLKYLFIIVASIVTIVILITIPENVLKIHNASFSDKVVIIVFMILSVIEIVFCFIIAMATALMIMYLSKTNQLVTICVSGLKIIRIFLAPILVSVFIGFFMVFIINPIYVYTFYRSSQIMNNGASNIGRINIVDFNAKNNARVVIYGDYDYGNKNVDLINIYNSVIVEEFSDKKSNIIKSENIVMSNDMYEIKNASILNERKMIVQRGMNINIKSGISQVNVLKQIKTFKKESVSNEKKYNIYTIIKYLYSGIKPNNDSFSNIKSQLCSLLVIPIRTLCAVLIVIIVTIKNANTRIGLKLDAVLVPLCIIGAYSKVTSIIGNIAIVTLSNEFILIFLPYICILCAMFFVINYKN